MREKGTRLNLWLPDNKFNNSRLRTTIFLACIGISKSATLFIWRALGKFTLPGVIIFLITELFN